MKYAILHNTFITGWVNCSTDDDGYPLLFDTVEQAQAELDDLFENSEFLEDIDRSDYKIVSV